MLLSLWLQKVLLNKRTCVQNWYAKNCENLIELESKHHVIREAHHAHGLKTQHSKVSKYKTLPQGNLQNIPEEVLVVVGGGFGFLFLFLFLQIETRSFKNKYEIQGSKT